MKKILIVEDRFIDLETTYQYLSMEGYQCEMANNKEEARAKFLALKPDLVILDIRLDDEDIKNQDGLVLGMEFLLTNPDIKFIVCSADEKRYEKLKANLGFKPIFLEKPVRAEEVFINVRNLIGSPEVSTEEEITSKILNGRKVFNIKAIINSEQVLIKLSTDDIIYIKNGFIHTSINDYKIICINEKVYPLSTLTKLFDLTQIHRNHSVNLDYVQAYYKGDCQIKIKNGTLLDVSDNYANIVKAHFA